jgi:hypothetical protein
MKKTYFIFPAAILMLVSAIIACKKKSEPGPNDLGGSWDLELTQVGRESDVYFYLNGSYSVQGTITVLSNDKGVVTYRLRGDLSGSPDSAFIAQLFPSHFFVQPGILEREVKFKITSEGIQDYFWDQDFNDPWTIVKYADGVGTTYPFKTSKNVTLNRVITEKTGEDDWPFGFYYIKTSKVEQELIPPEDEITEPGYSLKLDKITYRANHKFGLVYMEIKLDNGPTISLDIYPWFLM